jgi:thymidylate synthase
MVLPPCHVMAQFNVSNGTQLSCCLFQRSGDVGLGVPFNIASYAFLTHILARHCGLVADKFVYFLGNAHIYKEHIDVLNQQIERTPYTFPTIEIVNQWDNIEDYMVEDVKFTSKYECHPAVRMEMKA